VLATAWQEGPKGKETIHSEIPDLFSTGPVSTRISSDGYRTGIDGEQFSGTFSDVARRTNGAQKRKLSGHLST
jgi:hypothetical protein